MACGVGFLANSTWRCRTNAVSNPLRLGGSGACPSPRAKGLCNRLIAIYELPATSGNFFAGHRGRYRMPFSYRGGFRLFGKTGRRFMLLFGLGLGLIVGLSMELYTSLAIAADATDAVGGVNTQLGSLQQKTALSCFTIKPPQKLKNGANKWPSCNSLCAKKKAICTGVSSAYNPPPKCEDPLYTDFAWCRCCTVEVAQ